MIKIFENILSKIKFKDNAVNKHLKEYNISHYLIKYDLVEYNFKDIYNTFTISYFIKEGDLNNHFVDLDELQNYEAIEENTKNKIAVLIKKFKLRISIIKNRKFSDEMIISDDCEFEVSHLRHTDSLIKIAIVKDNLDSWLNGGKLNEYDMIFTTEKDYMDSLKNVNKNVFKIDDNCAYVQFKNVLNFLYKRKNKKFHYFVFNRFNKVFPKYKSYFKVLESEYFDEQWYKEEYELSENTDSVIHFLLVGGKKGYNPGPDFSSEEYYECNMDVKVKGVNPLVHYELYGRKENRIFNVSDIPKRDHDMISNSPYFDKGWYKATYDIPDDVDCAEHYLNEGYLKGYNPGPDFSTYEYWESNNDIRNLQLNPLLHYELYGRKEKRKLLLSDELNKKNYEFIAKSPYFNESWYKNEYNLSDDVDCVEHYLKIGFAKLYDPSNEFSTYEYYQCNEDVKQHILNPLLHYEKYGRNEDRKIHL